MSTSSKLKKRFEYEDRGLDNYVVIDTIDQAIIKQLNDEFEALAFVEGMNKCLELIRSGKL